LANCDAEVGREQVWPQVTLGDDWNRALLPRREGEVAELIDMRSLGDE